MRTTTVIDNEFVTLMVHPDTRIIHHQLHQPMTGEMLRTTLLAGVEQMRRHSAHKWLSDNRMYGVLPPEDIEWSQTTWFPEARKAGWRYWALVVPPDVRGRMNLGEFVFTYAQQGVTVQVFTDLDEAIAWLEAA